MQVVLKGLVEGVSLFFSECSWVSGFLWNGGFGSSFDCEGGLYKFMVGVECCGGVGGNIEDCALPGLWTQKVVQLDFVACGSGVGVDL